MTERERKTRENTSGGNMLGRERRVSESCTTNKRRERGKVGEGIVDL